jgi:hypothetical protein
MQAEKCREFFFLLLLAMIAEATVSFLLILGFQVIFWLYHGGWPGIYLGEIAFIEQWEWLNQPKSWVGLAEVFRTILDWDLHLSVPCLIVGFHFVGVTMAIAAVKVNKGIGSWLSMGTKT